MDKEKTCTFFGHRDITITDTLLTALKDEIEKAVWSRCRIFLFGGFGKFDKLCHQMVSEFQKLHPDISIQRIFCVPQERDLRKQAWYFNKALFEDVVYLTPSFNGWYKSIYYRNLAMIDNSDCIIFYAEKRENSGAYKAYKYAVKQKGKKIVNLYGI